MKHEWRVESVNDYELENHLMYLERYKSVVVCVDKDNLKMSSSWSTYTVVSKKIIIDPLIEQSKIISGNSTDITIDKSVDFSKLPTRKEYGFWRGIFDLFKW